MNIEELLKNTSVGTQQQMLTALLSSAFEGQDGTLNFGKEISGADLVELVTERAGRLRDEAEKNAAEIRKAMDARQYGDTDLDDDIHDRFSAKASELNNTGVEGQITYLVVEGGEKMVG